MTLGKPVIVLRDATERPEGVGRRRRNPRRHRRRSHRPRRRGVARRRSPAPARASDDLWRRPRRGADRRRSARPPLDVRSGIRPRPMPPSVTGCARSASRRAMEGADFLIIGGGIAGLSAAARLARHGRVDRARGRGGARLSQLGPKRLVQPLRHRQRRRARADRAQPLLLREPARRLLRDADRPHLPLPLFRDRGRACPRSPRSKPRWRASPMRSARSARAEMAGSARS